MMYEGQGSRNGRAAYIVTWLAYPTYFYLFQAIVAYHRDS